MTMQGFPLSQSPRTQGMGAEDSGAQVEELFNDGFTELAYNQFSKAFPELLKDVVTFKVLRADPDTGSGVGAFIVYRHQDTVFVPAVVSNNEVKPLDLFYSKKLNHYYPMSMGWLDHAARGAVQELGQPVKPPKNLATDVDIRNLVVPPTTGRYSYASDGSGGWMFPELLARSPGRVKQAMSYVLAANPRVREMAYSMYGKETLAAALSVPKTAAVREVGQKHDSYKKHPGGNLVTVADTNTPIAKLREMFGSDAGMAYGVIRAKGFYAKDYRKQTGAVVQMTDRPRDLVEPATSGLYRVYLTDGTAPIAFVLCNPVHLCMSWGDHDTELKNRTQISRHHRHKTTKSWIVVFKDGRYASIADNFLAQPIPASHSEVDAWLGNGDGMKSGDEGFFLSTTGVEYRGTDVRHLDRLSVRGERIEGYADGTKIVLDPTLHGKTMFHPAGQNSVVLPSNYRFHRVTKRIDKDDFFLAPHHIMRHAEESLKTAGAIQIKIACEPTGYRVGPDSFTSKAAALQETALRYSVSVPDANELLKLADAQGKIQFWSLPPNAMRKLAAPAGPPPAGPPGGAPMDPSMGGAPMDPSMMGAPPPPAPPTSIELAAAEMMQQLQAQQSSLAQQMALLQQVASRAQQIEQSGAGVMAAPMAAQLMAPPPPAAPPPGAPPGAPAPAGAPPGGADPNAPPPGAAPQGQVDPNTGMEIDPQTGMLIDPQTGTLLDPQTGQPPMARVTPEQQVTPQNAAQLVNPQFLNDAAQLADQNVFDAAAVSSIAQNPNVLELAQAYTPTLDKALDNLGRLLLLFYIKEDEIKESIGQEDYMATELKLRDVFRGLGESLLKIEQLAQRPLHQGMPTQ